MNFLGVVKHPNLVKLVGYCAEDDERGMQRLLVYELMRNRSLEDHLLVRVSPPLSWLARLRIAQDAARGLAYLHEEMDFQVQIIFCLLPEIDNNNVPSGFLESTATMMFQILSRPSM